MARASDDHYDAYFKMLLVGDSGTGKSSLLFRVLHNGFKSDSKSTIGVDIGTLTLDIGGKVVKAQVWDTAGQERYRAVCPAYYKGAHGVLLVYDVSNRSTFQSVSKWLREVREYAPKAQVLVCGNKTDLAPLRTVTADEGEALCAKEGLFFMEVSAKTADNVLPAFSTLLDGLYRSSVRSVVAGDEASQIRINTEDTVKIAPDEAPRKNSATCSGCAR